MSSGNLDPIADFYDKLKEDHDFRADFCKRPVPILADYGITLSPKAAKSLQKHIGDICDNLDHNLETSRNIP